MRHYYHYNCVSTVLSVFKFCMRVVLLLWVAEVQRSCQYYLRAALAVTYAWEGAYSDVISLAVEPVWYPIEDCRRKKLFIGVCVELVALKWRQSIF